MFVILCLILSTFASEENYSSFIKCSVPFGFVYNYDVYNREEKKRRFYKWFQNHERDFPQHFCSVDYSESCKFGIDLAADAVASCFMNRNIWIDPYEYMLRKTLENQLSNIQNQLIAKEELFLNALVKGEEFTPSESSERLDEHDLKNNLTEFRIYLESLEEPKREKYKLSRKLLNENFKTKYFDGKETIGQRRFELSSFEKSKDEVYKAHRNRLNAKRELVVEKENVHEQRKYFQAKMRRKKILYEISQSVGKTRKEMDMNDVTTAYEIQMAEAQIAKKVKLYRLAQTALNDQREVKKTFSDEAEKDLMERLLDNLQEMAPAQMKIHLAKFSDINPEKWKKLKRDKLRKKLAQVLSAKLDAQLKLSSETENMAPEEQKTALSRETTENVAPEEQKKINVVKVNDEFAEFYQNQFTHTTHALNANGYIESTIHCGKTITCVYTVEEIPHHFIYDNKEFRMSQIAGPTLQYTPLSGQKQKKEMLIELTYNLPYEVIAAQEPQIRILLIGEPDFVIEGVKRANQWHRKIIPMENLKIKSKATRKQLKDLYQQCKLKNGNQNGVELI